jgi:NAD(P)-dependent dehydrogenase (short-subunit alcohol dehydrogenase family)
MTAASAASGNGSGAPLAARLTCLVTGATSGIGTEIVRGLAATGARVLAVARDRVRGEAVLDGIEGDTELVIADLARQREVRHLAAEVLERAPRLEVVVHNAGVTLAERTVTEDGLETTFAVNHMAPFLLTRLLLDRLEENAPARVVVVASAAHRRAGRLDPSNLQGERRFRGWDAYSRSKAYNILFTRELARRLEGTGVTANCLHPGVVATGLGRRANLIVKLFFRLARPFLLSPAQGADTAIWLATAPEVESETGGYWDRRRRTEPSPAACDEAAARALWDLSERLTRRA